MPDESTTVILQGKMKRFRIDEITETFPYMRANVSLENEILPDANDKEFEAFGFRLERLDFRTVEKYQENLQINAFEFKLTDIRKVIRQAEENAKLVNKSWIVIPADRKSVISDKYIGACKEKGIGILYVEDGGRWSRGLSPRYKREIPMTQQLLNLMMKGY